MDEVVVVGCGGIGLPFAVALASRGIRLTGVDTNGGLIARLNSGDVAGYEPRLGEALRSGLNNGLLRFAEAAGRADHARCWVIAVPTPVDANLEFDDRAIQSAFMNLKASATPGDLVLIRSTVPAGFTRGMSEQLQGSGLLFASCPDRSVSGDAFSEQLTTPHIVGGVDDAATKAAVLVLSSLGETLVVSSPEAAETLKLFANVWRDTRFAIANQFALFCTAAGLDYGEIRAAGMTKYPRFDAPSAGPVGGPCLTKDVYLLAQSAKAAGTEVSLLLDARSLNVSLIDHVATTVLKEARSGAQPPVVAVLGLAFKGVPETLDQRGSVGLAVLERLRAALPSTEIRSWDPAEDPGGGRAAAATKSATIIVLANDHPALGRSERFQNCAPDAFVYDLCGILDAAPPASMRIHRFGAGRVS